MDTRLWLDTRFWDFVRPFENNLKYDKTTVITVIYSCTCVSYPVSVRFRKVDQLLRFLERISCDMFDEFFILDMFFSGRYTSSFFLIKDGKFIKF